MARLELVDGFVAVASGREHRRGDALDDVADVAAGHVTALECVDGRLDGTAVVVSEHDDQRSIEHRDAVLDGAQNSGIDDVAGGANDEHVAEALIEDDLGGDA